jgi:hypothetical protein
MLHEYKTLSTLFKILSVISTNSFKVVVIRLNGLLFNRGEEEGREKQRKRQ